ncbi:MAG: tRNA uridine-5-carboxymethylaminomethyl(34) synthesis GTPase MnmE [Clostridiales bacterium]|nr:tRNA uridine-5-carboxymethylaminomethyl(34) synthesis GTPase MnmE [Clostridiales bacterium]
MFKEGTIAAIATAQGEAGIGIIRISGENSLIIVDKIFTNEKKMRLVKATPRKMYYGNIVDPEQDKVVDEVLVVYMKAPFTYTKEDIIEINCHGGIVSIRRILELLFRYGARAAEPGEFTKRAFLNGRIDLSQAEAVMDLVSAKTDKGFDVAMNQLEGSLSIKVKKMIEEVVEMLAHIEVSIDFAEEDIDKVTLKLLEDKCTKVEGELLDLIKTAETGKIIREGIKTVIVGRPNVGKSSLMNALLKEYRAIVTEVAGTTRDAIEEQLNIKGFLLKIVDTAGIRETENIIEKIGIERTKELFNKADLILFMIDASESLTKEDMQIIELIKNRKALVIINKTDLENKIDLFSIKDLIAEKKIVKTSLKEGRGVDKIEEYIVNMIYEGEVKTKENLLLTNARHKNALECALASIKDALESISSEMALDFIEIDIRIAWECLGEVTGETVREDIIDQIFSNFCVGK